jgi:hypothetical protein
MSVLTKLGSLEQKLAAKADAELEEDVVRLREELRAFRRQHRSFREHAHAAVDATIAEAAKAAEHFLDSIATVQGPLEVTHPLGSPEPAVLRAAHLLAFTPPAFGKAWHAAVDRAEGFSELTAAEFTKRVAKLEAEIRACEVELERRRINAEREQAERELALLEKRL